MEKREDNKNSNNQKAQSNKETNGPPDIGLKESWASLSDSHSETGRWSGDLGEAPRLLT